jgi:hypothetical protein
MWDNNGFAEPNNWWGILYLFFLLVFVVAFVKSFFRENQ